MYDEDSKHFFLNSSDEIKPINYELMQPNPPKEYLNLRVVVVTIPMGENIE